MPVSFDDQFVMNVHYNGAFAKSVHRVGKDVAARGLYNVFNELRAIAFDSFPLFRTANSLVGDAL